MKLTIIRGLPGSGKSTIARKIASETGAAHIEADMFFCLGLYLPAWDDFSEPEGAYRFDHRYVALAHHWCQLRTATALALGRSVVVANTFTQRWEMEPYREIADRFGAELSIIVADGQFRNIHDVPQEAIDRMRGRWED